MRLNSFGGGGIGITPVVRNLLIINIAAFLLTNFIPAIGNWGSLKYGLEHLRLWQFFTYMFLHANFTHLLFNMLALWMFGTVIEQSLGSNRFLMFYLICGIGAGVAQTITLSIAYPNLPETIRPVIQTVGASGSVFGLLFAFGYLYPNMKIYFYFLIPIAAKYFVALYALLELYLGLRNAEGDNVAHFAHLGGMLFAFILLRYWRVPRRLY